MYDVIIIGDGPAGISASFYLVRAKLKTLVIGCGQSLLKKSEKIDNYYGFKNSIRGEDLLLEGEKQAKRLGVELIKDEVIGLEKKENFEILTTKGNSFISKSVLLATGQKQTIMKIEKINEFEGRGVSYCTTCDGFFFNNRKVGVLGHKDYAIHEANELLTFTKDITIFTNGMDFSFSDNFRKDIGQFNINKKQIKSINGTDSLENISFVDGTNEKLEGLFIALETASSIDFARKLGILVKDNSIIIDKNCQTNLEGVFAAGDCTGGFKQIATAVGEGANASKSIIDYIKNA